MVTNEDVWICCSVIQAVHQSIGVFNVRVADRTPCCSTEVHRSPDLISSHPFFDSVKVRQGSIRQFKAVDERVPFFINFLLNADSGLDKPTFHTVCPCTAFTSLSTHADRQGVDISVTVCMFLCTVTDFSAEDKASGVKFCTAVYWRPRQGISLQILWTLLPRSPKRSPKLDESAGQRASHAYRDVSITVEMRRRTRHARDAPFMKSRGVLDVGSACVDIRPSQKTDALVFLISGHLIRWLTHAYFLPQI